MNQAAKTVSDALLGLDFMNVEIGGMVYTIKPPTIKVFHALSAGMIVWSKNWRTALLKKSKMPWKSVSL